MRDIKPLDYEVASVKHDDSATGGLPTIIESSPGRFQIANATVTSLLQLIYAVRQDLIASAPDWTRRDRFAVQLTAPGSTQQSQPGQILKVLEDRFILQTHVERRELPVYELTRVREDRFEAGMRPSPAPGCEFVQSGNPGHWVAKCVAWGVLFNRIGLNLDRPLVDRTGLSGSFDAEFEWQPNARNAVSVFTAMREQLGLTAAPARGPVEVLIIDHIERPSED